MSSSFNLNNFLNEYQNYNKAYTAEELGHKAMETRDIQRAEAAVNQQQLLSLTLGEKLSKVVGKRTMQQIGETASNLVFGVFEPITDYLEKYENIFDGSYKNELNAMGYQMYSTQKVLSEDIMSRAETGALAGAKFVMDM